MSDRRIRFNKVGFGPSFSQMSVQYGRRSEAAMMNHLDIYISDEQAGSVYVPYKQRVSAIGERCLLRNGSRLKKRRRNNKPS